MNAQDVAFCLFGIFLAFVGLAFLTAVGYWAQLKRKWSGTGTAVLIGFALVSMTSCTTQTVKLQAIQPDSENVRELILKDMDKGFKIGDTVKVYRPGSISRYYRIVSYVQ